MLSLAERLMKFEEQLNNISAEDLFEELQSFESKGPLAKQFLRKQHKYIDYTLDCDSFWRIIYMPSHELLETGNDDSYDTSLAA